MKTNVESRHEHLPRIANIDDLRAERARLTNQVQLSSMKIRQQIRDVKEELAPARQAVNFLGNFLTNRNDGILNVGVNMGVDVVVRNFLLARAPWLIRMIVPFVVKNFTSNMIANNSTNIVEKGLLWVKNMTKSDEKPTEKKPDHEIYINGKHQPTSLN